MSVLIETPRLIVREPEETDAAALLVYYQCNEERFARWEPAHHNDLTHYVRWVQWRRSESAMGRGLGFVAFDRTTPDALVAIVNLYDIATTSSYHAMLGYSLDGSYEGRGYAREAVQAVIRYGFETLNLHRINANYHPANERSGALLRRLGFGVEGYARDMIYLRGSWRDHVLASLINPAWVAPPMSP